MMMDKHHVIATVDTHIQKYSRLADLAYERAWFKEQEQYVCIVNALEKLREELV